MTWRHYRYGMRYLDADYSRESILVSDAVRMAMAIDNEAREDWADVHHRAAGWR